jgi:hypothetical protein
VWHKTSGVGDAHLFTDATPTGWGAVAITPDNAVFATGGFFTREFSSINSAECEAVRLGVESFFSIFKAAATLRVVVDNTSTSADLVSGRSSSEELAAAVAKTVDALQALKGVRISLSYIGSKENPADLPSRGPLTASALAAVRSRVDALAGNPLPFVWSRVLPR